MPSYDEDRSDLDFTSNEGDPELAAAIFNKGAPDSEPAPRQSVTKIQVNDKTIVSPAE